MTRWFCLSMWVTLQATTLKQHTSIKRAHKTKNSNKMLHLVGDFNMNLLDYEKCKKNKSTRNLNFIYENSMIPTINKPTRVTRQSTIIIDHIITNCFINFDFKTAILKSDISDHFPISFFLPTMDEFSKTESIFIKE